MAVFDTNRTLIRGTRPITFIISLFARVLDWNDRRVTRNALSSLSDRELYDIGLFRGQINDF